MKDQADEQPTEQEIEWALSNDIACRCGGYGPENCRCDIDAGLILASALRSCREERELMEAVIEMARRQHETGLYHYSAKLTEAMNALDRFRQSAAQDEGQKKEAA